MRRAYALLLLLFTGTVYSQDPDSILVQGMVRDRLDKTPVTMASVELLKGDSIYSGDVTHNGMYMIAGSYTGNFTLQISAEGYKTYKAPVNLTKGKPQTLNITMVCVKCPTVKVFDKYDFSKGGYYILGIKYMEGDRSRLADSIGEFYTNDIAILNEFKQTWVFRQPSPKYACGYHFKVRLCRNGKTLEDFNININCNEIVHNNSSGSGYYYFDNNKLRRFKGRMKQPSGVSKKFSTAQEARAYYKSIINDSLLILAPEEDWMTSEGMFAFDYKFKEGCKDCYLKDAEYLRLFKQKIQQAYPGEPFTLAEYGGSMEEVTVQVVCNKSLYDKFTLYPIGFYKWRAWDLGYYTYWKKKPK